MAVCQRVLYSLSRSFYKHKFMVDKLIWSAYMQISLLQIKLCLSDLDKFTWSRQTSPLCVFVGQIYLQVDLCFWNNHHRCKHHPTLWSTTLNQDFINSERSRFHERRIISAWEIWQAHEFYVHVNESSVQAWENRTSFKGTWSATTNIDCFLQLILMVDLSRILISM